MSAQAKAIELGVSLEPQEKGYLNLCIQSGDHLITSGHVSDLKGILGKDLSVDDGYEAAKDCMKKNSVIKKKPSQWEAVLGVF